MSQLLAWEKAPDDTIQLEISLKEYLVATKALVSRKQVPPSVTFHQVRHTTKLPPVMPVPLLT